MTETGREQMGLIDFARTGLLTVLRERERQKNGAEKKEGAAAEPCVPEKEFAEELGISRDAMRELRELHLIEGPDWKAEKKKVLLTLEACAYLKKEAGLVPPPLPADAAQGAVEAQDGGVEEMTVHSVARNIRILDARKKDGALVRVRVRDNRKFVKGMEIKARPSGEFPDVYVLEGRAPRFRGRW